MPKVLQVLDTDTGKISYLDIDTLKNMISNIAKCVRTEIEEEIDIQPDIQPLGHFFINSIHPEEDNTGLLAGTYEGDTSMVQLINGDTLTFTPGNYVLSGTIRIKFDVLQGVPKISLKTSGLNITSVSIIGLSTIIINIRLSSFDTKGTLAFRVTNISSVTSVSGAVTISP